MAAPQFTRRVEDFTCAVCGTVVKGDGYTNHCSHCLWSKHVDINPGDRASSCLGLMEPIRIESKGGEYIITHQCTECGFEKRQRSYPNDRFEALLEITTKSR